MSEDIPPMGQHEKRVHDLVTDAAQKELSTEDAERLGNVTVSLPDLTEIDQKILTSFGSREEAAKLGITETLVDEIAGRDRTLSDLVDSIIENTDASMHNREACEKCANFLDEILTSHGDAQKEARTDAIRLLVHRAKEAGWNL